MLTLSLENIVFGCSSCVLDLHVRFARAVRHISFRSATRKLTAVCGRNTIVEGKYLKSTVMVILGSLLKTQNTYLLVFGGSMCCHCDGTRCSETHS